MSPTASLPTPQEIHRKLSVHSVTKGAKASSVSGEGAISGTESDSDSALQPGASSLVTVPGAGMHSSSFTQQPLSSIAERGSHSGDDTEEEEEEGGWSTGKAQAKPRDSSGATVIKSGYLWKKGERRKSWKKRWFVLRTAHLAYYKNSAEYELLRLLQLSDVHSCTKVSLKKHENTFGLVSPKRTYYLQAKTPEEVQEWVQAIEETRHALTATSTQNSASTPISSPIPIPTPSRHPSTRAPPPITPSPPSMAALHLVTSSESDEGGPGPQHSSSLDPAALPLSPNKYVESDPGKFILSGYLMKCGSKRHNWRKRWFVLTSDKLVYSGSHMDTKPHRQFLLPQIVDALEYDLPSSRHNPPNVASPPHVQASSTSPQDMEESHASHTFKIVTVKRTLLVCAPTEADEIKWLGSIRALIARRSGLGEPTSMQPVTSSRSAEGSSLASVSPAGGNVATKVKPRRPSASGSGIIAEEVAPAKA